MRKSVAVVLIGVTAVVVPVCAVPAQAASAVQIASVYYDSPGSDDRSNRSLNAEYVTITNTTSRALALRGWTLRDATNHVYVFAPFTLGARASVTVHTGTGADVARHRYQNRGAYVWNNDKDTATLRNASRVIVDSCGWTRPGTGKIRC
jgi:hypothetical protein